MNIPHADESIASHSRDHIIAGLFNRDVNISGGNVNIHNPTIIGRQNVYGSIKNVDKKNIWFDVKYPVKLLMKIRTIMMVMLYG